MDQAAKRRAILEIVAAIATGGAFVAATQLAPGYKLAVIIACMAAWMPYVAIRVRRDRGVLREWGIRTDNLRDASKLPASLGAAVVVAVIVYRVIVGPPHVPGATLAVLALYPVWALFQQFFVQSMIARNLVRLRIARFAVIGMTAALFGLVHAPDAVLAAICFAAGIAWTASFVDEPNLIVLALAHGWLGALVYSCVLERDPLGR